MESQNELRRKCASHKVKGAKRVGVERNILRIYWGRSLHRWFCPGYVVLKNPLLCPARRSKGVSMHLDHGIGSLSLLFRKGAEGGPSHMSAMFSCGLGSKEGLSLLGKWLSLVTSPHFSLLFYWVLCLKQIVSPFLIGRWRRSDSEVLSPTVS